jgi:hypothetical protein
MQTAIPSLVSLVESIILFFSFGSLLWNNQSKPFGIVFSGLQDVLFSDHTLAFTLTFTYQISFLVLASMARSQWI